MTIPIEREPEAMRPYEQCCFCWARTPFWTTLADRKGGAQVACCQSCAATHEPTDVPTKDAWFEEARAKNPRFYEREPRSPWAFQGQPVPLSVSAPASSSPPATAGTASSRKRSRPRGT